MTRLVTDCIQNHSDHVWSGHMYNLRHIRSLLATELALYTYASCNMSETLCVESNPCYNPWRTYRALWRWFGGLGRHCTAHVWRVSIIWHSTGGCTRILMDDFTCNRVSWVVIMAIYTSAGTHVIWMARMLVIPVTAVCQPMTCSGTSHVRPNDDTMALWYAI